MKKRFRELDQFLAEYMPTVTRKMFLVCLVVFVVLTVLRLVGMAVPLVGEVATRAFILRPDQVLFQGHVWQLVTCVFAHTNVLHLFFNLLGLFFFGPMVEHAIGSRRFAWMALLCGVAGALAHVIVFMIARMPGVGLLGFSGALYGIITFAVILFPRAEILFWFIPMQLRVFALFMGLLLLGLLVADAGMLAQGGMGSGVSNLAHAAGVLMAIMLWKAPGVLDYLQQFVMPVFLRKKAKVVKLGMGHPGRHTDPDDRYDDPHWRLDQ